MQNDRPILQRPHVGVQALPLVGNENHAACGRYGRGQSAIVYGEVAKPVQPFLADGVAQGI